MRGVLLSGISVRLAPNLPPYSTIFDKGTSHLQLIISFNTKTTTTTATTDTSTKQKQHHSVVLPRLVSSWRVDQAIMSEEERLVIIRFGRD
jgi:hypothetical protein